MSHLNKSTSLCFPQEGQDQNQGHAFLFKNPDERDDSYLQLSSGHFENKLHYRADSEASRAGGVHLVPNGVTVHLETQNPNLRA